MKKYSKLIVSILTIEILGYLSSFFTITSIPTWYNFLRHPFFSPPNSIFAPVWTILYFLMGVSVYIIWNKGIKNTQVKDALKYFLIQLFLNYSWTIIFFGFKSPSFAFAEIVALWIFIAITISKFYKISEKAAYLLVPYILWVSFAALLNYAIIVMN